MRRSMVVGAAALVVVYPAARRWAMRWGASVDEVAMPLPGDELIADPSMETTRAITIDAPAVAVWPWLVQMGQDRAGLYSYDWLERLVGLEFQNADRIVPEWQRLAVGDQIRSAPASAGPEAGFTVVAIDPGRSIVTAVGDPAVVVPSVAEDGRLDKGGTWTFVLHPLVGHQSRLVVRMRLRFGLPGPLERLAGLVLEPIHFFMERKQLLGIAERATRRLPLDDLPPGLAPPAGPAAAPVAEAEA
ncbi:MAG: hypothetical protein ACSLFP_08890 [Acidimicrobiales bacterium]